MFKIGLMALSAILLTFASAKAVDNAASANAAGGAIGIIKLKVDVVGAVGHGLKRESIARVERQIFGRAEKSAGFGYRFFRNIKPDDLFKLLGGRPQKSSDSASQL